MVFLVVGLTLWILQSSFTAGTTAYFVLQLKGLSEENRRVRNSQKGFMMQITCKSPSPRAPSTQVENGRAECRASYAHLRRFASAHSNVSTRRRRWHRQRTVMLGEGCRAHAKVDIAMPKVNVTYTSFPNGSQIISSRMHARSRVPIIWMNGVVGAR